MDFKMPQFNMPKVEEIKLVNTPRDNLASEFYKRIKKMIIDFNAELNEEQEIGVRLVTFGQTITFQIDGVGYSDPSLIIFTGILESGDKVRLIQHVSQISFILMAIKKKDPEAPRQKIGFVTIDV